LACTARDSRTGTRFASAPAARTASMVAHNDQVKGGRVPGFPHPVEPAGGTRRHGWGYREPRSSADTRRRCRPQFVSGAEDPSFRSQPVGHESFGHEQSFCPAALSMPPLDGESVARRTAGPITPRGAKNPRCIPVSVQLTELTAVHGNSARPFQVGTQHQTHRRARPPGGEGVGSRPDPISRRRGVTCPFFAARRYLEGTTGLA
jgi:hypothetical protein